MRLRGLVVTLVSVLASGAVAQEQPAVAAPVQVQNYSVSWIGNSYPGGKAHVPQDIDALWVTPDGTVYSNVSWEEGGGNCTVFKDGAVLGNAGHTHGWGYEGGYAVATNSQYLFISGRMANEGGGLVDPATWPPKGFDWLGVSRRPINDIRKPAPFPGGKGGKGDTLKEAFCVVDEVPVAAKANNNKLRNITSLCATETVLYIACPYDNTVKLYDPATMARVSIWPVERPLALALDKSGTLWVLQAPADDKPAGLLRLDKDGKPQAHAVVFPSDMRPVALCFDNQNRLLVSDDGPRQQIAVYERPLKDAQPARWLGTEGGILAGRAGAFGDWKFNRPTAIGCDAAGKLYVAHRGSTGGGSTILECYDNEKLAWRLFGLNFVDMADVDPASDVDVFTKEERFVMDYSKPAGQQWRYAAYTVNAQKYPQDPRVNLWSAGAWVRRIEGKRVLFVLDMNSERLQVYRFNEATDGEIAIPAGLYSGQHIKDKGDWPPHQPASGEWFWSDTNGNGAFDADEYFAPGTDAPRYQGWCVDVGGNLWQAAETQGLRMFPFTGFTAAGVPQWNFAGAKHFPKTAEFKTIKRLRYDSATDTMFLGGTTAEHANQHWKPMGPVLACYDKWSGPERSLRWKIVMPYAQGSHGHESCEPMGFDVAGDYVFVPYTGAAKSMKFTTGHIEVFRIADGKAMGCMEPSTEIGEIGLQDLRDCLRAHRRADGEYLLFLEEDYKAKILLYRWKP